MSSKKDFQFFDGEIDPKFKFLYSAIYLSNYDGDTIDLLVDTGFGEWSVKRFRLMAINTPELRGGTEETKALGYVAKAALKSACEDGRIFEEKGMSYSEAFSYLFKKIKRVNILTYKDKKGKYGRYLLEVLGEGGNVNQSLIAQGLAEFKLY